MLANIYEYRCLKHLSIIFIALLLVLCLWALISSSQCQFYGFSFRYHWENKQAYIILIIGMIIILHRKANIKYDAQRRETCAVNKFTKEKKAKQNKNP